MLVIVVFISLDSVKDNGTLYVPSLLTTLCYTIIIIFYMDTLIVGEFQELCPEGIGKTPDGKGGAFFTFDNHEILFFSCTYD